MTTHRKSPDKDNTIELSLLGALVCILIAVGFFAFIFLWHMPAEQTAPPPPPLTDAQKNQILQQLNPASSTASNSEDSAHDRARKMRILEQLQH